MFKWQIWLSFLLHQRSKVYDEDYPIPRVPKNERSFEVVLLTYEIEYGFVDHKVLRLAQGIVERWQRQVVNQVLDHYGQYILGVSGGHIL